MSTLYGGGGAKFGEVEDKDVVFESGGVECNAGTSSPLSLMLSLMMLMVEYKDTTAALG